MSAVRTSSHGRMETAKIVALWSLLHPLLFLVALVNRIFARIANTARPSPSAARTLLAETADKVGVAISYALMGRHMLHSCAQQSRPNACRDLASRK